MICRRPGLVVVAVVLLGARSPASRKALKRSLPLRGRRPAFTSASRAEPCELPRTPHLHVVESTSLRADSKNEILIQLQVYLSALASHNLFDLATNPTS